MEILKTGQLALSGEPHVVLIFEDAMPQIQRQIPILQRTASDEEFSKQSTVRSNKEARKEENRSREEIRLHGDSNSVDSKQRAQIEEHEPACRK